MKNAPLLSGWLPEGTTCNSYSIITHGMLLCCRKNLYLGSKKTMSGPCKMDIPYISHGSSPDFHGVNNRWCLEFPSDCLWTPPFSHQKALGPKKPTLNPWNFQFSDPEKPFFPMEIWRFSPWLGSNWMDPMPQRHLHFEAQQIGVFVLLLDSQSFHHLSGAARDLNHGLNIWYMNEYMI